MNRRAGWLVAAFAWVVCSVSAPAQQDNPPSLNQRAAAAYQAKDFAAFLALGKQALTLAPLDPRVIYNVACGEAIAGHAAESVHQLDRLLSWGLDFNADKDPDFAHIYKSPEWSKFQLELADLRRPLVHSAIAFTLPEKGLLATSVVIDEKTSDAYIASAREQKIVKRDKNGVVSDFATDKDGLYAVSYLLIDPLHGQLIASVAAVPFMRGFRKEDDGKTGVLSFDLATGKLARKVFLPANSGHHLLNQTAVDRRGNLFVIDSASREIYRLRRSSSEFELYVSSVVFPAPQGLVFSADERTLYVVDYIEGVWAMEVLSIDRRHIDSAPDVFTVGLLGLTRVENGFVGVQKGVRPNRVVRLHLDEKGERFVSAETLERNHPAYSGPTEGTISGSDFLYIANSQLDLIDPKTLTFPAEKAEPTTILRLPLGK